MGGALSDEAKESVGVESIKARLREEVSEIEALKRRLKAVSKRRDLLATKLVRAGLSLNTIAPIAGINNVAVHQATKRAEAELARKASSARTYIADPVSLSVK